MYMCAHNVLIADTFLSNVVFITPENPDFAYVCFIQPISLASLQEGTGVYAVHYLTLSARV